VTSEPGDPVARADVELTEAEVWELYENPAHADLRAAVERILADRLAAVQAEAEIAGQMKHITAEMVRGNQPLEAKEEMIADLRARLSHVEAERDGWQARAATNREGWAQMQARAESAEAERDEWAERANCTRVDLIRQATEAITAERDEWKSRRDAAVEQCRHLHQDGKTREQWHTDNCGAMGEVANLRAERDDLRARLLAVETLSEEAVFADFTMWPEVGDDVVLAVRADDLRAVLASPSTHTQRDTEAQRDARLDNLIEREERAAEGCLDCKAGEPHMCPDAQRDTETAAQALREAADELPSRGGYSRMSDWLRARADSLATEEGQ
jgi:hypothetical protein